MTVGLGTRKGTFGLVNLVYLVYLIIWSGID
jgi:hypothetical protein